MDGWIIVETICNSHKVNGQNIESEAHYRESTVRQSVLLYRRRESVVTWFVRILTWPTL